MNSLNRTCIEFNTLYIYLTMYICSCLEKEKEQKYLKMATIEITFWIA